MTFMPRITISPGVSSGRSLSSASTTRISTPATGWPIEPIFRCYHYEEQYYFWKMAGETEEKIAENYLGVCMQSNWDKRLDLIQRFRFSKLRKRLRRLFRGY